MGRKHSVLGGHRRMYYENTQLNKCSFLIIIIIIDISHTEIEPLPKISGTSNIPQKANNL
jgi:hypothetical protein